MAAMAVVGCGAVMAQESRFSAGLELAMPMGDFGDLVGFGFGGSLGYEIPVGDNLGVMAQAGYISFSAKDIEIDLGPFGTTTVEGKAVGAIPIQLGAKYYFSDNQEGAYLGVLTGVHLISSEGSDGSTDFGVAPLLGFMVGENIDIALRYQMLFHKETIEVTDPFTGTVLASSEESTTNSYLGVRAAYMFGSR